MPIDSKRTKAVVVDELLKGKREQILKIAAKHGARNVRVFGSVARGEADGRSDVDCLVEMEPGRSLLDMGGLLMELRELLGRDVDVVTERGLKPRIRARVLREAVALWEIILPDFKRKIEKLLANLGGRS